MTKRTAFDVRRAFFTPISNFYVLGESVGVTGVGSVGVTGVGSVGVTGVGSVGVTGVGSVGVTGVGV
ncbi:hypothetical protein CK516_20290, partial [Nostoc sp. 'Peltigera malacea cyanobiont' DB3992]